MPIMHICMAGCVLKNHALGNAVAATLCWRPPAPTRCRAFSFVFFVALLQGGQLRGLWGIARAAGIAVVCRGHNIFSQPLKGFASSNACTTQCAARYKSVVNVFINCY